MAPATSSAMTPRHFLDLSDLTPADLRGLLDRAHARKAARAGKPKGAADADQPLNGHMLGMVFDKPSTRTRLSFDLAMRQLGGQTMLLNHADTQLGRGESIEDTARVMSRFCDIVMLRTGPHENLLAYADGSDVPVINGLTAFSHPCQILADLMTFEEHKGALAGQRIAWFGDGNNVAISLAQAAALLGFEFALAVPDAFMLPDEVLAWAADKPGKITRCDTPQATAFAPYQVTQELMARGDDAIFLHCLPAYRGNEVTADVIDGPKSVVFDEAENRCHAQKAVLIYCLGIDG